MAYRPIRTRNFRERVAWQWVWRQHWLDLLFLHWQVPVADLRCRVPAPLEVDTHEGHAWVSLVLFRLRIRPRWLPFLPVLSTLVEANLRTYVHLGKKPGIWFLSVHADNGWAIRLAKLLTPMPYVRAELRYRSVGRQFEFTARCPSSARVGLSLTFLPEVDGKEVIEGTLDAWLLERYRLFVLDGRQRLIQAQVAHRRWVTKGLRFRSPQTGSGSWLGSTCSAFLTGPIFPRGFGRVSVCSEAWMRRRLPQKRRIATNSTTSLS